MEVNESHINPKTGLKRHAEMMTAAYGLQGTIIISCSEDRMRIGTHGLDPQMLRDALCYAIAQTYEHENATGIDYD